MKLKPHKGVYKIRIYKTHGKRVPMSSWVTRVEVMVAVRNTSKGMFDPLSPLVTDISRVPKRTVNLEIALRRLAKAKNPDFNPLEISWKDIQNTTPEPIVDIDAILNFEPRSTIFNEIGKPKPSLWQRIKRKVKR